ncbi:hypothetical protein ACOME3_008776 [Neoechinorhynchus agilis]
MSIVEFFKSIAVNNLSWNEGADAHSSAFDGRTLALMEQYFPAPAEQLFRIVGIVWNLILTNEVYMNTSGPEQHFFALMDAFAKESEKIFIVVTVTLEEIETRVQRFFYPHSNGLGSFPYDSLGLSILNGSSPNEPLDEIPCQEELLSYLALSNNSLEHQVMGRLNVPYNSGIRLAWNYDPGLYFYPLIQLGFLRVTDLPAVRTRTRPEDELKYYSAPNILPRLRVASHKLSMRLDTMQVSVKTLVPQSSWTLGMPSEVLPRSDRTVLGIINAYMGVPLTRAFAAWAEDPNVTVICERTILHWAMVSKLVGTSIGTGATAYSENNDITFRGAFYPRSCKGEYDFVTIGPLFAIHVKLDAYTRLRFSLASTASWETRFDKGTFDVPSSQKYADPFGIESCFEGDSQQAPTGPKFKTSTKESEPKATSEPAAVSAEDQL